MMEESTKYKEHSNDGGYHKLEIYQPAHSLAIRVHKMSLTLPKIEMYEEGSQIRRSAKSVPSNIVEGFALRKYKNEFLHYLYRSHGSSEETVEHLKILFETESLKDQQIFQELLTSYVRLNSMLSKFIQGVETQHSTPYYLRESEPEYFTENEITEDGSILNL